MSTTPQPSSNLTLADLYNRMDPDGKPARMTMLLSQTNEVTEDAVFVEGNLPTGMRYTLLAGLPAVYYRSINQGIPNSKSTSVTVDESCGILEARSHIDVELAALNGNSAAWRLSEEAPFLEAMNQTWCQNLFYGNPAFDARQSLGFSTRYSSQSAGNGQNILDAGGSGSNNTSIYLIGWSDQTVGCPFPKGSQAGLKQEDLGQGSVQDAAGNYYEALKTLYNWKTGLMVKDWRYVVRIANINVADLITQSGTQAATAPTAIINLMSRAIDRIPFPGKVKLAFYANRTVYSILRIAALNKSTNALGISDALTQFGTPYKLTDFLGVPLRKVDQLLLTEARVN